MDDTGKPLFSLGRLGIPINVVAVVYQLVFVVNLMWPRSEIYDLAGKTWWLQWSALLFLAVILIIGALVNWRLRTKHGAILLSRSAPAPRLSELAEG